MNIITDNLFDYCSSENWTDFPGVQMIILEKSLIISNTLISDMFVNNSSNDKRINSNLSLYSSTSTSSSYSPYCLIRVGNRDNSKYNRIYASGSSSGIATNGKRWFTESLHFMPTAVNQRRQKKVREVFETSTHQNALELVFEHLPLEAQLFYFNLVVTPFRDKGKRLIPSTHLLFPPILIPVLLLPKRNFLLTFSQFHSLLIFMEKIYTIILFIVLHSRNRIPLINIIYYCLLGQRDYHHLN